MLSNNTSWPYEYCRFELHVELLTAVEKALRLFHWCCLFPMNAARTVLRGVLILHPWAKLGGSMEDPTVITQFR
jgi:hypothetical protein